MTPGLVITLGQIRVRVVEYPEEGKYARVRTPSGKIVVVDKKLLKGAEIYSDPYLSPRPFGEWRKRLLSQPQETYQKKCKHCDREFISTSATREVCRKGCKRHPGRRDLRTASCERCGTSYVTKYDHQLYCSRRCRRSAHQDSLTPEQKQVKLAHDRRKSAERRSQRRAEIEKSLGYALVEKRVKP